jgi:hypothetical protein
MVNAIYSEWQVSSECNFTHEWQVSVTERSYVGERSEHEWQASVNGP